MKIKNLIHALVIPIIIFASCGKDKLIVTPVVTAITITEFYPQKMITGSELTILGTNFDPVAANNIVKINGVAATVSSATTTTITAIIPTAATSGKITVNKGALAATSGTDFTVMNNPYQNVRLKSIYNASTKKRREFIYDSANKLTSQKWYATNFLGLEYLESTDTYSYTASGKLDKDVFEYISPASKITYVTQYVYVNGVLSTITYSNIDATNTPAVTKVSDVATYDIQKGVINGYTYVVPGTTTIRDAYKFNYSILDGNPKTVSTFTANVSAQSPLVSTTTTVEYAEILNPLSLYLSNPAKTSLLLEKSVLSSSVIGAYDYTYTLDATGKITAIAITHPVSGASTSSYTYENKN